MLQAPRAVWVHVEAERTVMLQVLTGYEGRWRDVCLSPCDGEVPLDGVYRVIAAGIMTSRELELEASPGDRVTIEVNVRTLAEHHTAERLTIAGYIVGAVGLGLEIGALAVDTSSPAETALLVSGAGAAVGAITLAITSYVMGQPSGLSQGKVEPMSAAPRAWVRAPLWHEADASGPRLPKATGLPLFTAAF
jgi:hypothetical protein